jgi:chromosome partitioning protein
MVGVPYDIAVLSEKGGVGKTTLALHLAWMFTRQWDEVQSRGEVVLVDADPQASVIAWQDERQGDAPFRIIKHTEPTLHEDSNNPLRSL